MVNLIRKKVTEIKGKEELIKTNWGPWKKKHGMDLLFILFFRTIICWNKSLDFHTERAH